MKKYYILIIIALFFSTFNLYSIVSCYNRFEDCTDWTEDEVTIQIPDFPGCNITVYYRTRICDGIVQIYQDWFKLQNTQACWDLWDCIAPEWPNPVWNWGCVERVREAAYKQVSYLYFLEQTQNMTDNEKEQFLCGSNNFITTHAYFTDVCRKFCIKLVISPEPPYAHIYVVEGECTNEICCTIELKYCFNKIWDPGQGKFVYYPTVIENRTPDEEVNCDEINPVSIPCPTGYTEVSPCMPSCENQ